jgi:hypothetical protein
VFLGPAGPEPVPQPSGRAELALSLAPRLQGSGEVELVPWSSDGPGMMPGLPKRSWAFSTKAHDQAPAALWIAISVRALMTRHLSTGARHMDSLAGNELYIVIYTYM